MTSPADPASAAMEKSARSIFGKAAIPATLDLQVPFFTDRSDFVPEIDPNYEFQADTLIPVLWALKNNKKAWLSGHTGTGKSTLVAQVCARLNWGMIRVNFDSEISRMDLVGRDVLKRDESGATISSFVDGILPQALQQPVVLLCDEVDFIRPDVAYVFQRALEDQGLLISEDGGRLVKPHPYSRIIATANTRGQGDDNGIYQGARAQSMAFLDRFTVWVECHYLPEKKERELVCKLVPGVSPWLMDQIMAYAREHRVAFENAKIMVPLSPRTLVALTQLAVFYENADRFPVRRAARDAIQSKCGSSDEKVVIGFLDRVVKEKKKPGEAEATPAPSNGEATPEVVTEKDAYAAAALGSGVIAAPSAWTFTTASGTASVGISERKE